MRCAEGRALPCLGAWRALCNMHGLPLGMTLKPTERQKPAYSATCLFCIPHNYLVPLVFTWSSIS